LIYDLRREREKGSVFFLGPRSEKIKAGGGKSEKSPIQKKEGG